MPRVQHGATLLAARGLRIVEHAVVRNQIDQERRITKDDLRTQPLITSNTPPAEARWFVGSVFGRQKPKLTFMRLPLTEAIIDAARAKMGIAVLSEWMASGYLSDGAGDLVVKRLSTGPLRRPWRIAYRKGAAHAQLGERWPAPWQTRCRVSTPRPVEPCAGGARTEPSRARERCAPARCRKRKNVWKKRAGKVYSLRSWCGSFPG
jgi:DNA-binding transcriptional LysR family regulator